MQIYIDTDKHLNDVPNPSKSLLITIAAHLLRCVTYLSSISYDISYIEAKITINKYDLLRAQFL